MSHASVNRCIGLPFLVLDKVDSSNNYAMGQWHAGLAKHGQAYFALNQFAGKGQRGKTWNAAPGENITISVVITPEFPNKHQPFLLSAVVSLGCVDFFSIFGVEDVAIKWPNDIYWRDRKAGGILIENVFRSNEWKAAIVGIGLNINQTVFPQQDVPPVSLKQITGTEYDPVALAKELCGKLDARYTQLLEGNADQIMDDYNSLLYQRGKAVKLKKGNIVFTTTIKEVSIQGHLHTRDTHEKSFSFGEVEWMRGERTTDDGRRTTMQSK